MFNQTEDKIKESIAQQLRAIREEMDLTQKSLSLQTGVAEAKKAKLENAEGPLPRVETLVRLMRAMGRETIIKFVLPSTDEDMQNIKKSWEGTSRHLEDQQHLKDILEEVRTRLGPPHERYS